MKKLFSSLFALLFGARAESTPPPPPATPVSDSEDRTLEAIWLRYWEIVCPPTGLPSRRQDYADYTRDWPRMLREHRRFVMARLPVRYERDTPPYHPTHWPFPLRSDMQAAGGFAAYCQSDSFREYLRPHVIDWQRAALAWNQDPDPSMSSLRHEPNAILNPDIVVFLLDPDGPGLDKVRIPRWPFPPPEPPAPAPAKLIPPPTQPGIAGALRPPVKKKKPFTR